MSDIAEGMGGVMEGALVGGAVEPEHGTAVGEAAKDGSCKNCGAQPLGTYCQNCGQKTHVHRTLAAIGHDLLHGVLHLDGKFWNTLPMLLFKPGQLTRRYIEGERARFVSPMAMFLFSVFAMFAVFQMVGLTTPTSLEDGVGMDQVETSLSAALEKQQAGLADVEEQLTAPDLDEDQRAELEAQKAEIEENLRNLEQMAGMPFLNVEQPAVEIGEDGSRVIPLGNDGDARMTFNDTGIDFIDEGLAKKWQENPGLMLYKLQANGYKFSWLLIPLSIPFVWLTFAWRRRFKAYDHAIFVTYSLSFMTLLFITASLVALIPGIGAFGASVLLLAPPIHIYKQLRGAYQIGRLSAVWRLMALSLFIWIVVLLFLQTLLLIGAF